MGFGFGDLMRHVACDIVDVAQGFACRMSWTATALQRADAAVLPAGAMAHEAFRVETKARLLELLVPAVPN
jgi:hypothetical protein